MRGGVGQWEVGGGKGSMNESISIKSNVRVDRSVHS